MMTAIPGGHPVAVISYSFWKRKFALDRAAVGKVIRIFGHPFTIIGGDAAGVLWHASRVAA